LEKFLRIFPYLFFYNSSKINVSWYFGFAHETSVIKIYIFVGRVMDSDEPLLLLIFGWKYFLEFRDSFNGFQCQIVFILVQWKLWDFFNWMVEQVKLSNICYSIKYNKFNITVPLIFDIKIKQVNYKSQ
jgi:hypothetical protein